MMYLVLAPGRVALVFEEMGGSHNDTVLKHSGRYPFTKIEERRLEQGMIPPTYTLTPSKGLLRHLDLKHTNPVCGEFLWK